MEFEEFKRSVEPLILIDHSARGGSFFFTTIFDRHPQVLSIPAVPYLLSYLQVEFPNGQVHPSKSLHAFLTNESYFRHVYHGDTSASIDYLSRLGIAPLSEAQVRAVRTCFDSTVLEHREMELYSAVKAVYFSIAVGLGKDQQQLRYLLISDCVSLASEYASSGYSGIAISRFLASEKPRLILSLVRDPRATFASLRHQLANSYGNLYGFEARSLLTIIKDTLLARSAFGRGFIPRALLLYYSQTRKTLTNLHAETVTVRNEELNCDFAGTMAALCTAVGIECLPEYQQRTPFASTVFGRPWSSMSGYSPAYHQGQADILSAEGAPSAISGPNEAITKRWKQNLTAHEVTILEFLFVDVLVANAYEFTRGARPALKDFLICIAFPFRGELRLCFKRPFLLSSLLLIPLLPFLYFSNRLFLVFDLITGKFRNGSKCSRYSGPH